MSINRALAQVVERSAPASRRSSTEQQQVRGRSRRLHRSRLSSRFASHSSVGVLVC